MKVRSNRWSWETTLSILVVVAAALSACSSDPAEDAAPTGEVPESLGEVFTRTLETSELSTFERDILERAVSNNRIANGDYEAAHQRYVACMARAGFNLNFRKAFYGLYIELPIVDEDPGGILEKSSATCSSDNATIRALYRVQETNPGLLRDPSSVALACLASQGKVSRSYTVDQLVADQATGEFPFDPFADVPSDCLYAAGWAYLKPPEK